MNIYDWRSGLVLQKCMSQERVLIVTLPFLKIPGFFQNIFPKASLFFISFQEHKGAISANLREEKESFEIPKIEYLNQHFKLVEQYWETGSSWPQWQFLEGDFCALSNSGFSIKQGDINTYKIIIKQASRLFANWIRRFIVENKIESLCVYGRGHWTMNATGAVAKVLNLPLFVVERGILAKTVIVDINMPFTAHNSIFRKNWMTYLQINSNRKKSVVDYKDTQWDIYLSYIRNPDEERNDYKVPLALFIGQCLFDLNLLNSPFNNIRDFIKLCISRLPRKNWATLLYRPHPLSPEVFHNNKIIINHHSVLIDKSSPKNLFCKRPLIVTWNSTLGLEASLFFNCKVITLDKLCYYNNVIGDSFQKSKFLEFLQEVSINDA